MDRFLLLSAGTTYIWPITWNGGGGPTFQDQCQGQGQAFPECFIVNVTPYAPKNCSQVGGPC